MNEAILESRRKLAQQLIPRMEKRQFEVCYCDTGSEAFAKACSYFTDGCSIANGGSTTLKEIGMMSFLAGEGGEKYNFIDRSVCKTMQEKREVFAKAALADYYLMSTNAFTLDGELVNIDGVGNRVAALCFGPENVIVIAGMNKLAKDVDSAIERVHLTAAPPNALRLSCKTPCAMTGQCGACLSPDCICAHTVVTRFSRIPGRIKVILVGEDLGY